ncbi:hypothetical protein [Methylorubrum sp. POS3]|uniref:hypothetical protein n=1 Tax=Methylorubrum sp. POS3 TaxID=2998492 RepID=UPI00372B481E
MTPSDSPFARCYDLCEDHLAAIVFERLTYWWRRGTRVFKGVEWRAKPRAQLERECRMSPTLCRRALEKLKAKQLVETSQHRFGTVGPVLHYRILPRGLAFFAPRNEPVSGDPVLVENAQHLVHNGGMVSKNPYGLSNDNPPEFLDADFPSSSGISGKEGGTYPGDQSVPKKSDNAPAEECPKLTPKKNTPKAPSPAKTAIKAKLGMSASAILGAKKVDGVFLEVCR